MQPKVARRPFQTKRYPCTYPGCLRHFKNPNGRSSHLTARHPGFLVDSITPADGPDPHDNDGPPTPQPQTPPTAPLDNPIQNNLENIDFLFNDFQDFQDPPIDQNAAQMPPNDDGPTTSQASASRIFSIEKHPHLTGRPCDSTGRFLDDAEIIAGPPPEAVDTNDWYPYNNRTEFEFADFIFREEQMSGAKIDRLCEIIGAHAQQDPPFADHNDLYATIDATTTGEVAWQSFSISYTGERPAGACPNWMKQEYDVWFRDPEDLLSLQLANPEFAGEMDWTPKRCFSDDGQRVYQNFMSGNWAWRQADIISESDPSTEGATFVPAIGGSDKTTVSVATGQHDYYPFYVSLGNVHNNVRRGHRNAVSLAGFLSVPKTDREFANNPKFRRFRNQLFHSSLAHILQPLRAAMTTPVLRKCADGHYRRIIYGLGPYIADYPEQALLACIVQGWCPKCLAKNHDLDASRNPLPRTLKHRLEAMELSEIVLWDEYGIKLNIIPFTDGFPRADIYELLSPDLLHQLIKGTFKDHLVDWVVDYIKKRHTETAANRILADIDQRIAAAPSFPNLRRFPEGRGFKQWTGDDSKALMKVFLPAIAGHVPDDMVKAIAAFLNFCYLVRRNVLYEEDLKQIDDAVTDFHRYRDVFKAANIRTDFNLPRQHSIIHYRRLIQDFGAPNGLCSSITESKHIKAVKEPYRRSNHHEALGQMLLTNQRIDKLAASRIDFTARGMLKTDLFSSVLPPAANNEPTQTTGETPRATDQETSGAIDVPAFTGEVRLAKRTIHRFPRHPSAVAQHIRQPQFTTCLRRFIYEQIHANDETNAADIPNRQLPPLSPNMKIRAVSSAIADFYAPSDMSGKNGMYRERIRSTTSCRKKAARRDLVFVNFDPESAGSQGFQGLEVARVLLLFSFRLGQRDFPCAFVSWYERISDEPCPLTGMWHVKPELDGRTVRGAHLLPIYGEDFIPPKDIVDFTNSLDAFAAFYVNKYADHHAHEIAY